MLIQKAAEGLFITLSGFPQHPATGLVHEILVVAQKHAAELEGVVQVALPDESVGADHGNAPVPEKCGPGHFFQDRPGFVQKPGPGDVVGGLIDQVPVVDPTCVC